MEELKKPLLPVAKKEANALPRSRSGHTPPLDPRLVHNGNSNVANPIIPETVKLQNGIEILEWLYRAIEDESDDDTLKLKKLIATSQRDLHETKMAVEIGRKLSSLNPEQEQTSALVTKVSEQFKDKPIPELKGGTTFDTSIKIDYALWAYKMLENNGYRILERRSFHCKGRFYDIYSVVNRKNASSRFYFDTTSWDTALHAAANKKMSDDKTQTYQMGRVNYDQYLQLKDKPDVRSCQYCRKTSDKSDVMCICSRCQKVYYCNSACQAKDWINHSTVGGCA